MEFLLNHEQYIFQFAEKLKIRNLMHFPGAVLTRAVAELILAHGTLLYEGWVCSPIYET